MLNSQTLERLVMDRTVGELSPDAAELLEAYLSEHPASSVAAQRFEEMLVLAGRAVASEKSATAGAPEFPRQELLGRRRAARRWAVIGRVGAMAACVAGGFLAALWAPTGTSVSPVVGGGEPGRGHAAQLRADAAAGEASEFWAWRHWRRESSPSFSPDDSRIVWNALFGSEPVTGTGDRS